GRARGGRRAPGTRGRRRRHPPGAESMPDAHDPPIAVEEDNVDREPHEEHVYRAGPIDQHPRARIEPVAAEQSPRPPKRALRYFATLADDGVVPGAADARERFAGHDFTW